MEHSEPLLGCLLQFRPLLRSSRNLSLHILLKMEGWLSADPGACGRPQPRARQTGKQVALSVSPWGTRRADLAEGPVHLCMSES